MKKVFTLILGLMLSMISFAQKTVAVYVTASEGVPQETKRILGSELVAAITRNPDYVAIERTDDFLAQVSQEQGRYNNIDDKKLFELGQKYGASNVCVAEITKFGDEYYIVSRLLDIRTQRVWKTARKSSELKSLGELMSVSEAVADELIGNTKEFSTYAYGDNGGNESFIVKIVNRDSYTIVSMKYVSVSPNARIGINRGTYIEDIDTHEKYYLVDASNINIMDSGNTRYTSIGKGIWEYSFIFNRITEDTKHIRIIEPNGWAYKDIVLKPYGDENTFVFEDNTQKVYDDLLEQERIRQQQIEEQYSQQEYSTCAYGDNGNNQSFLISLENKDNYTKVTFKYLSLSDTQVIGIGADSYIEDIVTGRHYKLKNASNINIVKIYSDNKDYKHIGKGIWEYSLFFERIPERTRSIKIIDKNSYKTGWIYNDIVLKPYGKPDYYVFKDDTDSEYKKLQDSYVYYINFENRHSDPRNIYINGKYIGQVKGYGYKKLTISVDDYGHLESIQASGYLVSPNKESWNVPKQTKGTTINLKN